MPKNFDFGDGNVEPNEQAGGSNEESKEGTLDAEFKTLNRALRSNEGLPPYIEEYLFFLRNQNNEAALSFFQDLSAFFANNPGADFPNQDLIDQLQMFIRKALDFRDNERFRQEREAARARMRGGGGLMLASETRQGRIDELMRSGMLMFEGVQLDDLTEEQLDRAINRLRQRRREAREERRQRQQEARLFPTPQGGPYNRSRTIEAKRAIGNNTLDPITRYYHLNFTIGSTFTKPLDDGLNLLNPRDAARISVNQTIPNFPNQASSVNEVFTGNDRSISNDVVVWSLGGYLRNEEQTISASRPVTGDLVRKWNECFRDNGTAVDPDNLASRPNQVRYLFQSQEGSEFGQVEGFNFPARMNELALAGFPKPVNTLTPEELETQLNRSFTVPETRALVMSLRFGSQQSARTRRTRMQAMLSICGEETLPDFFRGYDIRYPGAPIYGSGGYEFYDALKKYFNITDGSLKDNLVAFAGLSPRDARRLSERSFKSFSFYDFEGHSSIIRDVYGHMVANSENALGMGGSSFGYITPEYNYYDEKYETATAGSGIPHTLLPNFYTYIIASDSELPEQPDDGSVDFLSGKRQSTVRGQAIQQITLDEFSDSLLPSLNNEDISSYLDAYSEAVGGGFITSLGSQLTKLYRNIGIPAGEIDLFNRLNTRSHVFPMAMKIGVPTGPIGPIGALIEQTGTSTSIMNILVGTSTVSEEFNFKCNAYQAPVSQDNPFAMELPENGAQLANLAIRKITAVYDFETWITNIQTTRDDIAAIQYGGNSYRAGGERMPDEIITLSDQHFIDNLKTTVDARAREVVLSYSHILNSIYKRTFCHSETFMYKLRKFTTSVDGENPNLVGEFYFPNTQLSQIIEYVDTQVKYEETYQYEVVGYEIVFGSEFRVRTDSYNSSGGAWDPAVENALYYKFNVETLPNIKVVEYPIATRSWNEDNILNGNYGGGVSYPISRITDNPPVAPNVFVYPYKDNYRQVLMNFQPMNDDRIEKFISMSDTEREQFERISKNQKRTTNFDLQRGEVRFKNESLEEIKAIQVFRTQEINPSFDLGQSLYDNFRGNLYQTVSSDGGLDLVDTLIPNQKYYYMFRTVDRHDQVSNPSEIYEVLLSYSEGVYIPKIKMYNPEENLVSNSVPSKRMARFIEIKAADLQSLTYDERNESGDLVRSRKGLIEEQDDRITDSKFLVRLTSRDTGRKINIVVDFKER